MPVRISKRVNQFLSALSTHPVQRRVADYVIGEVHKGRSLKDIVGDPYVRDNLNSERVVTAIMENPRVLDALEQEIHASLRMDREDMHS